MTETLPLKFIGEALQWKLEDADCDCAVCSYTIIGDSSAITNILLVLATASPSHHQTLHEAIWLPEQQVDPGSN